MALEFSLLLHGYNNTLLYHYTKCYLVSLLSSELSVCCSCILCPGILEVQGLGYTLLVSECWAGTVICWRRLLCGIWQRYRLLISQQPLPQANFIDFVVRSLWFLEEGDGHTQFKPTLHATMSILSQLITHSFPRVHGPTSTVLSPGWQACTLGLHSALLFIAVFESVHWFITKPWCCNQADHCFVLSSVQHISRISWRRANLFPPLASNSTSVCQLSKKKSLKC